ncbi:hypothetical protein KKF34_14740 [Myxococcota bacterium]|nr:hypothetical protein [Myxococcota bacterium]MBU1382130.1 hypothetical protein [Myxococcota bacterium]MBU1498132.1 hypothetical protein [Myxococcota bacterium]
MKTYISILMALLLLNACAKETPGIDPVETEIFFPTGLLLKENTLFVTNGNSDLKYNGSTISALDFQEILSMLENPLEKAGCYPDPENISEFLCDLTSDYVQTTLRTGNFAGYMIAANHPGTDFDYRLYVSVRGDPSVTFIDVSVDNDGKITCMDCGNGCDDSFPRDCKRSNRIEPDDALYSDPFRFHYDSSREIIVVSHLSEAALTVIDNAVDPPMVSQVLENVFTENSVGYAGGFSMASVGNDRFFATNAYGPEIMSFSFVDADPIDFIIPSSNYYLQAPWGPFEYGAEARGMVVSSDGNTLYSTVRYPPLLLAHDLTPDENHLPSMDLLGAFEIPMQPSLIKTSSIAFGYELIYIANFSIGQITVVDPVQGKVIENIDAGSGPSDFIFVEEPEFTGIISANFGEGTISFIKIENGIHKRIGRLGKPQKIGN